MLTSLLGMSAQSIDPSQMRQTQQYQNAIWQQRQSSAYQQGLGLVGVQQANPNYLGLLNTARPPAVLSDLPWAVFIERVRDWSTDRLLQEVRRLRADRAAG